MSAGTVAPVRRCCAWLLVLAAAVPACAGADEVDELVRRMLKAQVTSAAHGAAAHVAADPPLPERAPHPALAADRADRCAWQAGDELVLKLGKDCPPQQVAATVRQAVQRQAVAVNQTRCGPMESCRERRAAQKLQRYSSLEFERRQAGAPRYYGQK